MPSSYGRLSLTNALAVRLVGALKRAGLAKTAEQICQLPLTQRQKIGASGWLTGPIPKQVTKADVDIPAGNKHIGARLYRATHTTPTSTGVLYIHGGGWVFGGLESADALCAQLAFESGAPFLSVDYRLAPDHPYPSALDDCYHALKWLADNSDELGIDPQRIALMGDSAGGNLAASLCHRVLHLGGPPIALQALIYPATDATLQSPSMNRPTRFGEHSRHDMERFYGCYLPAGDITDPSVSPLLAEDCSGLPPALIITADCDVLRDEGSRYAARLRDAGVHVRYSNYLRVPHGFLSTPRLCPAAAAQARAELVQEIVGISLSSGSQETAE